MTNYNSDFLAKGNQAKQNPAITRVLIDDFNSVTDAEAYTELLRLALNYWIFIYRMPKNW